MATSRTWLAIPALALVCAAIAAACGVHLAGTLAIAALGAALAAAVRALAGASLAASLAGAAAALLGAFALAGLGDTRAALAGAAAMFAIAELVRPLPATASPWPALAAAIVAGLLDPSCVALVAVAGARVAFGPWPQPRWTLALPVAGGVALALALVAACARGGVLGELWLAWAGRAGQAEPLAESAARAGDALGPLVIVGAAVGLASCAAAGRFSAAAVLGVAIGAAAVSARLGGPAPSPALSLVAALACGVAIARLASLVRHPVGQACVSAVAAFVVVVAPAWTLALAASRHA